MESDYQSFDFEFPEVFSSPESHMPKYEEIIVGSKTNYKCLTENCGKILRFKSDMKRHLIVHSKEKPFVCKYPSCGKGFKRQDALNHHLQTLHQDFSSIGFDLHQKPVENLKKNKERFICDFPGCEKSFWTLKDLKQHQEIIKSHKKDLDVCDCFLNHYEETSPAPYKNSFDDEHFSPKLEKFLRIEDKRATIKHPEVSKKRCEARFCFEDFVQLMFCKDIFVENQLMRGKLGVKADPIQAKVEDYLKLMLQKALSLEFE